MADLVAAGEHCSTTERRADDATRDVNLWLKCEYLRHHIGDEFVGVVASVTRFGMFVELSDIYMEGLVHISALPSDYYHFDQASQRLVGEHTRKTYQLGDAVRVQVARVDLDDRKIDLEIVGDVTPGAGRRGNKTSVRRQSRASDAPSSKRSRSGKAADRRLRRVRVVRIKGCQIRSPPKLKARKPRLQRERRLRRLKKHPRIRAHQSVGGEASVRNGLWHPRGRRHSRRSPERIIA